MKKFRFDLGFWFVIILTGLVVTAVFLSKKDTTVSAVDTASVSKTRNVALMCTTDAQTTFHIHPQLTIVINGEQIPVPANIGVNPGCMNPLHTHDTSGAIHVESPVQMDFTLGDFFAVWHKDFSQTKILDYQVGEDTSIGMTINGTPVDTYENTILKDNDKIVITYGKK